MLLSAVLSPRTFGVEADLLSDDDMEPFEDLRRRAAARDAAARDIGCWDCSEPIAVWLNGEEGSGAVSTGDGGV